MSSQVGIEISGITAAYEASQAPIFKNLRLRIGRGQVGVIVGPSGAGKTTLLNCVAGLHPIDGGYVVLAPDSAGGVIEHGHDKFLQPADRRRIGVAFQQSNLWSHFTVREHLLHPQMKLAQRSRADANRWADELLTELCLIEHAHKPVTALSGGQRQRVAIARALCLRPEVILFDEITANQDPANVQRVFALIRRYVSVSGATALTVSHDMAFVRKVADVIAFLKDGVIQVQATPEQFFDHCQDEAVQTFLSAS